MFLQIIRANQKIYCDFFIILKYRGEKMLDPMDKRKQLIAGAVIFFAVIAAIICYYFIIYRGSQKIPTKGVYVEAFKATSISSLY